MRMACCSVLRGGGTNQELVLHCLHECGGDFLVSSVIHNQTLDCLKIVRTALFSPKRPTWYCRNSLIVFRNAEHVHVVH